MSASKTADVALTDAELNSRIDRFRRYVADLQGKLQNGQRRLAELEREADMRAFNAWTGGES